MRESGGKERFCMNCGLPAPHDDQGKALTTAPCTHCQRWTFGPDYALPWPLSLDADDRIFLKVNGIRAD